MGTCTDCGMEAAKRNSRCKAHHAQYMRDRRKSAKANPSEKTCSKCSDRYMSTTSNNICRECQSRHKSSTWSRYSRTINRNNDDTRRKVRNYQNQCILDNYAWLLEEYGSEGKYQCQKCSYKSEFKEDFDLHHENPGLKRNNSSQIIKRRTFKKRFTEEGFILVCHSCHKGEHTVIGSVYHNLEKFGINPVCVVTGEEHDWPNLEFHHYDPSTKKFNIASKMRTWGKVRVTRELLDEILKCVIVKTSVHRLIHKGKVECPAPHYELKNLDLLDD